MNKLLSRKINLLLHLAHVDGKFHYAERAVLRSILEDHGFSQEYMNELQRDNVDLSELKRMTGKDELLYWVLKLIHADGHLHKTELSYSKIVAAQLGFREEVVDHFSSPPPSLTDFKNRVKPFKIPSIL